jgi:hypothetical protein
MESIPEERYLKDIKPLLLKVFNDSIFHFSGNISFPFCASFNEHKFLFAHSENTYNTKKFWNALRDAVLKQGDICVYEVDSMSEVCHIIKLKTEEDYFATSSSNRAYFSPSCDWGMYEDMDGFAFLGGSQSFIDSIRQACPQIDAQFSEFLREWKSMNYATDNRWLPELLLRLFGEKRAKELLEEAEKMDVYCNSIDAQKDEDLDEVCVYFPRSQAEEDERRKARILVADIIANSSAVSQAPNS